MSGSVTVAQRVTVVVGHTKPASRTLDAGRLLAEALCGRAADEIVDVVTLGPGLLGWGDPVVGAAVETVRTSAVCIVASPTFKATYSGVLKLFLDQFSTGDGLAGVMAVPLMLGAGPAHAMAPDLLLKPVLVELGATCPTPGLYLRDTTYATGPELGAFADRWAPVVRLIAGAAVTLRRP